MTQGHLASSPFLFHSLLPKALILASLFPFLFSFLQGLLVKWWLRELSVPLGTVGPPWRGTEKTPHLRQLCSWSLGRDAQRKPWQSRGFWEPFPSLPLWARKPPPYRLRGKNKGFPLLFTTSGFVIITFLPDSAISPPRFKTSLLHDSSVRDGKLCDLFVLGSIWKNDGNKMC